MKAFTLGAIIVALSGTLLPVVLHAQMRPLVPEHWRDAPPTVLEDETGIPGPLIEEWQREERERNPYPSMPGTPAEPRRSRPPIPKKTTTAPSALFWSSLTGRPCDVTLKRLLRKLASLHKGWTCSAFPSRSSGVGIRCAEPARRLALAMGGYFGVTHPLRDADGRWCVDGVEIHDQIDPAAVRALGAPTRHVPVKSHAASSADCASTADALLTTATTRYGKCLLVGDDVIVCQAQDGPEREIEFAREGARLCFTAILDEGGHVAWQQGEGGAPEAAERAGDPLWELFRPMPERTPRRCRVCPPKRTHGASSASTPNTTATGASS